MDRQHEIDWESLPLGKVSDRAIAEQLGVGRAVVRRNRARLGIPPMRRPRDSEFGLPYRITTHVGEDTREALRSFPCTVSKATRVLLDNVLGQAWPPEIRSRLLAGLSLQREERAKEVGRG